MNGAPLLAAAIALGSASLAAAQAIEPAPPPEPAATEPGQPVRMTLDEAIARARATSPTIGRMQALQAAAGSGARAAEAERMPALDLSASYTRLSHVPELSVPLPGPAGPGGAPTFVQETIFPDIPDAWRSRLDVRLPLYTSGRIGETIQAAQAEQRAATGDLAAARSDLDRETAQAFWDLLASREDERTLREGLAAYDAHLKQARDREEAGLAARNEVLAVQVERDRAELGRLQASGLAEIAAASLGRLTGLPAGAAIEPVVPGRTDSGDPDASAQSPSGSAAPAGSAPAAPPPPGSNPAAAEPARTSFSLGADAPARAEASGSTPSSAPAAAETLADGDRPLDELLAAAYAARPERAAVRARAEAAAARARAIRAQRGPQAALDAGYDYANPNHRILPLKEEWDSTWDVGVGVSWSVFDGGRIAASAAQAESQAEALRRQAEELDLAIRLEVATRATEWKTARAALVVADGAVVSARENQRVAGDRYREGVIPSAELLDAETALLRAGLQRTRALAGLQIAGANLRRALGMPAAP